MIVEGINPKTGDFYQSQMGEVDNAFFECMRDFSLSDDAIGRMIDKLDISADAKSLLFSFSKGTIRVGEYILKVGKKVIDLVFKIFKEYPSASFGVIFGATVGFLISSIPVLGVVLGPLFTSIAVAIGLVGGVIEDIKDKNLYRKIREATAIFSPLSA